MSLLLVGFLGAVGVLCRYAVGELHQANKSYLATIMVNILGSFIIGLLFKYQDQLPQRLVPGLMVGFCGGLTTFSSFTLDAHKFIVTGNYLHFVGYSAVSLVGGLLAFYLAIKLTFSH